MDDIICDSCGKRRNDFMGFPGVHLCFSKFIFNHLGGNAEFRSDTYDLCDECSKLVFAIVDKKNAE